MTKMKQAVAGACLCLVASASQATINLLANSGFETGDFSGWTVEGNSIQEDVATDGTPIPNADPPFPPNFQNVRSGQFAGNALIRDGLTVPAERIILSPKYTSISSQCTKRSVIWS